MGSRATVIQSCPPAPPSRRSPAAPSPAIAGVVVHRLQNADLSRNVYHRARHSARKSAHLAGRSAWMAGALVAWGRLSPWTSMSRIRGRIENQAALRSSMTGRWRLPSTQLTARERFVARVARIGVCGEAQELLTGQLARGSSLGLTFAGRRLA